MSGNETHRLTVPRELRCFPCLPYALEAPRDVGVGAIHQPLHGGRGSAGRMKIGRDVVSEQILQNVGAVVQPIRFLA